MFGLYKTFPTSMDFFLLAFEHRNYNRGIVYVYLRAFIINEKKNETNSKLSNGRFLQSYDLAVSVSVSTSVLMNSKVIFVFN